MLVNLKILGSPAFLVLRVANSFVKNEEEWWVFFNVWCGLALPENPQEPPVPVS
jgi:hypothetical protein